LEPDAEIKGNGYAQEAPRDFARSMPEAIERLRGSALARDWLGDRFVEAFAATREFQHGEFQRKVPDVELERFFDLG
jgi:glutamine synthetase